MRSHCLGLPQTLSSSALRFPVSTWVSSACTHSPEILSSAVSWENHRVNPIHCLGLKDHCPPLLDAQYLEKYWFIYFAWILLLFYLLFIFQERKPQSSLLLNLWPSQSHCLVTLNLYVHYPLDSELLKDRACALFIFISSHMSGTIICKGSWSVIDDCLCHCFDYNMGWQG